MAKACAPDPADRFATVAELRVQLHGVLREVVATDRAEAAASVAAPSLLFGAPDVATSELEWRDLPRLAVDPSDPQVGWLATLGVHRPRGQARRAGVRARSARPRSCSPPAAPRWRRVGPSRWSR